MGFAFVLYSSTFLFAQEKKESEKLDEVVISATKFKEAKENTAKVIYQITQEQIQKNQGTTIIDLLNRIPGIDIRGVNTNPSEPRGLFVRGGRGRQVLVLIDGVPVSDPSGINQEFDLRYLSLNQIERIEVLKGASSTLYGTGAATGVINIILKKAKKDSFNLTYETSLGTNNSIQKSENNLDVRSLNSSVSYAKENFSLLTSINLQSTTGQSSAIDQTGSFDEDPFSTENLLVKLGYQISDNLKVSGTINQDHFRFDYDNGGFADSKTNNGKQNQTRLSFNTRYTYKGGEFVGSISHNRLRRTDYGFVESVFEGRSTIVDLVNKINLISKNVYFISGINFQKHVNDTFSPFGNIDDSIANFTLTDPYASFVYKSNFGFNANVGGRLNIHTEYGNHFVYDISVAQNIFQSDKKHNVKFITSYSSAFISPSTYQLFSDFGNVDLNPETSTTFEFGFDTQFGEKLNLNAVYFNRQESNAIIFASINVAPFGQYQNASSEIQVDGIETELSYVFNDKISFNGNYTYTNRGQNADYIPSNKWLATIEYSPVKNLNTSFIYRNVGERSASFFDAVSNSIVSTSLENYSLLDVNFSYKFYNDMVTVFGQVTNLLNEYFQDILGFTTRGRNYLFGLRLNL